MACSSVNRIDPVKKSTSDEETAVDMCTVATLSIFNERGRVISSSFHAVPRGHSVD